ncbi:MAG: BlaI/MecI/CopY family transcriptional regulator [Pseudomonadota bacterium]
MTLSDFELEVLQIFWRLGDLSVPRVHEEVHRVRKVTYSTVKTIVDRLEKKGALVRVEQHGRTIIYAASVDQESLRRPLVREFVDRVFGSDRSTLFSYLMEDGELSQEEIESIQKLVTKAKRRLDQ